MMVVDIIAVVLDKLKPSTLTYILVSLWVKDALLIFCFCFGFFFFVITLDVTVDHIDLRMTNQKGGRVN